MIKKFLWNLRIVLGALVMVAWGSASLFTAVMAFGASEYLLCACGVLSVAICGAAIFTLIFDA